jgi:FkbM family methyltransferase
VNADSQSAIENGHSTKSRPFAAAKYPLLNTLLGEAGIKLVDVGGRGSAFPGLVPLAAFSEYYVSEPDREEAHRLEQQLPLRARWRAVTVMSEAIASRRGEANLYVTEEPGMSSLLEPDVHVTQRLCLGGKFRVVSVIKVPTIPLDEAASHYGFGDACFLKLDTQGTELDILQSGSRLVQESVLGVYVECSFQPFYKGQALFSDVDAYLRQNGFVLFSLSRTNLRRAGYRSGLYSRRVTVWAHCLYLREPETLLTTHRDALPRHGARLLGLALALQQYDLAIELTTMSRRVGVFAKEDIDQLAGEVRRYGRDGTRHIVRKAQAEGLVDVVMAPGFRDKNRLE